MSRTSVALFWMLIVLTALSIPGSTLPQVNFDLADKVAHAACFFVLGLLWMRALTGAGLRRAVITLTIGVLFGVASEVYQGLMPINRLFDPLDAVADAVGVLLAVVVDLLVLSKKARAESNPAGFTVS